MTLTPGALKETETVDSVRPARGLPGPPQGAWTYRDYGRLPDDGQRYEILDGVLLMTPAPDISHQRSSVRLVYYLMQYVEFAELGRVLHAPVDVELSATQVFQPDILVVLGPRLHLLHEKRVVGAPDLLVEIASPTTARYDRGEKKRAYASAGVREYWIVDPRARTVEVLVLSEGEYHGQGVFAGAAMLQSSVIPDVPVSVQQLFGGL